VELTALVAIPVLAYLVITLLVAFDAMIPAVPSEVALVTAGTLAAAQTTLNSPAAAVLGALAGDYTVYSLGRARLPGTLGRSRLGRRLRSPGSRFGAVASPRAACVRLAEPTRQDMSAR
jgi:membrane-associated protein